MSDTVLKLFELNARTHVYQLATLLQIEAVNGTYLLLHLIASSLFWTPMH